MTDADGPNAQQFAYWNTGASGPWVAMNAQLDEQLAPFAARGLAVLDAKRGERVLDIGCGAGATTLMLADSVGEAGVVLGVDISEPLLAVARERARQHAPASLMHADAQTHAFAPQSWDALFSRFGVMFFADPPAAFANMRRALKPGGRMTFVCWRTPAENPLMTAPMQAALPILGPPEGPPADPRAPGPFAFAAQDYVAAILSAAGFAEAHFEAFDAPTRRGDLEDILAVSLKIGPLGARLRERPDMAPKVIEAVRAALAAHMGPDGLNLNSGAWIVSARNRD